MTALAAAELRRPAGRRVLLVRDVPEENRLSMDRFADELAGGLAGLDSPFAVRSLALHERSGATAPERYFLRFLRYPVSARRSRTDLWHIVDQGYAQVAALLPPERTVVTCHDLMLLIGRERETGVRPDRRTVLRFRWAVSYLKRAARVVCVSDSTREDAIRLCGVDPRRAVVIPNGLAPTFRRPGAAARDRTRASLGADGPTILHVSTGIEYKNVPATLHVVAELRRRGLAASLVRVGAPLAPDERDLARRLGIEPFLLDCGRVPDDRLAAIYGAADLLLFPSWYEGFGWPVLEAMACGTPVVASSAPALVEIAAGAALTERADDIRALADAAQQVLTRPALAGRLREAGLARARQFSWSRTSAAYARVYDEVLACAG
jgi:glycosyltransferase involved in cell wall biosynthesis